MVEPEISVRPRVTSFTPERPCRVLSLDGGGSKGFYSIGVLFELENICQKQYGKPLHEYFDLIYGTSTGAIIAALLAMGKDVTTIHALYEKHVPSIMGYWMPWNKSKALRRVAGEIFGTTTFAHLQTRLGVVATNWNNDFPWIFKSDVDQAFKGKESFIPGFGLTVSQGIEASCAAFPFFMLAKLKRPTGDVTRGGDGGFCANNPTLYAIADAMNLTHGDRSSIRVVSVGVGHYPEKKYWGPQGWIRRLPAVRLLLKVMNVGTSSMENLREVLFGDISTVRISGTYNKPELAMDLTEDDLNKLGRIYRQGCDTGRQHGDAFKAL
jgi:patatin-like phospholipase/acyl hydrolase